MKSGTTTLQIKPGPIVRPVLERVVGALTARTGLPIDRLNDVVLVLDAIPVEIEEQLAAERLQINIDASASELSLELGPFRSGCGGAILEKAELPGAGNVIARLVDHASIVQSDGKNDWLHIRLAIGAVEAVGSG